MSQEHGQQLCTAFLMEPDPVKRAEMTNALIGDCTPDEVIQALFVGFNLAIEQLRATLTFVHNDPRIGNDELWDAVRTSLADRSTAIAAYHLDYQFQAVVADLEPRD